MAGLAGRSGGGGVAEVGQRGRLAGLVEELVVVVDLACGVQEEELDAG
jgi:hypothetical protein